MKHSDSMTSVCKMMDTEGVYNLWLKWGKAKYFFMLTNFNLLKIWLYRGEHYVHAKLTENS